MRQKKAAGSLALLALLALAGLIFGQTVAVHDGGSAVPPRRIVPTQVELLPVPGSSGGDPWRLFDGDTSRGFVSQGEGPARIRMRLGAQRSVSSVGIYGPAEGRLSVLAREDGVWIPILDLDLHAGSPGWRRWELETPVFAAALLLEWQGMALPEVELWGSGTGPRTVQASEERPGVFRLQLDADPGAFPRAYLSYELAGLAHWTGAVRSINGLPAQGGFPVPGAGLQTEEINPRWLRQGLNEVRFFPEEEAPYTVRNLRLVLAEEDGRPAIDPSPLASALVDGIPATGWDGRDGAVDLPFRRPFQVHSLEIETAGRPEGTLTVEALLAHGDTAHLSTWDLAGTGRHRLPLDEAPAVTGLRLSWNGAGEEDGQIVEAEILGSPVGSPRRAQPRIVLTHPLQRETAEGGAYLRGFVEPGRPELLVDGSTAEIQPDGAFGLFVPGPEEGSWEAVLEAAFADGTRLSRTVLLGPGKEPSDPNSLAETQAAPGQAKTLSLAGARLEVGAGALAGPVKLSMRSLAAHDLPALDAGMTNVTPRRGGFRMGPHGLRFRSAVHLTLPYDAALLPEGMTADDVRTFYFDEEAGRWMPLPRLEVGTGAVVSATDHFTDFINATVALPDEPTSADLAPGAMQELAKADPAAGIVRIEPPAGGPHGSAVLDFPIVVPPGRQGLEPGLAVRYDSDRGNGWLGIGWDLSMPGVEVSTLFGVPRYDGGEEYLLEGERLAATGEPGRFVRRVEGSFQRIVRHGSRSDDFWWEVTEKDGTRYLYGRSEQARLRDYRAPRNTFRWLLERVIDLHGNTVDYTYATDSGIDGERWTQVYPSRIDYTGVNGAEAYYQVRFFPETGERPDPFSSGMPGFKVLTRRRLGRIDVAAGGSVVRSYRFEYHEPGAESFYKSLLASVVVSGEGGEAELYRHTFDYFRMPVSGGEIDGFSEPVAWGSVAGTDDQSETSNVAGGGHAFVGLGDTACANHGGVQVGGGGGATTTRLAFLDVNGDGLTDRIAEDGAVAFNRYDPEDGSGGFSGGTFPKAHSLGHNDDWFFDFGAGGHLLNDLIVGGVSWTWSHSNDDRTVADLDGDGRPDLVSSGSVRLNDGSGFGDDSSWSRGAGSFDLGIPGEEEQLLAAFPLSNPLRKLVLPFDGTVSLTGGIRKPAAGGDGATVEIHHGGSRIWQREIAAGDTSVCTPGPAGCGDGLTLHVSAGDRLYFLAGSILGTAGDALSWAPRIAYTAVSGDKDLKRQFEEDPLRREPDGTYKFVFDAREDFRLDDVGKDLLSGGWHGWFYGEWNGDAPFAEAGLKEPEDEEETPLFVAGMADTDGIEGVPGPIWTAAGFDLYLSADGVKPSRRGRDVVADLGSAGGSGGSGGPGLVRKTSGTTVGMSFSVVSGISLSCGSNETQLDLLDLNGDRYPDQVLGAATLSTDVGSCFGLAEEGTGDAGAVRLSNGHTGFEGLSSIEGFESPVRRTVDSTIAATVGLGLNYSKKDGQGNSKAVVSAMPSVGSALSLSQTTTDLVDVNGDGLPDRVIMTPGSPSVSVRLNLGNRFGDAESWSLPAWASDSPCHDFATIAQAGLSELTSFGTFDSLRHNRSSAVNAGVAVGPIGGGVGTTLSRTVVDLADVNGDGLLDHVARDQDGAFRVKLNRGDRWGSEESWSDPSWGLALDDMGGLFQCLDAVSSTSNIDGNGSVGAPICIPLKVVGIRIEISVQASGAEGGTQLFFEDLDGDGLADRVLRGSDKTVYVKSNKAGKVNLLAAVHRPLGSTVTLDYKRQGNRVGTAADGRRIDMPASQWALSSTTVGDGRGNLYRTGFEYFNDAFYDRAERESYGYARVRTTLPDGSTVDRTFHNQDYTRKGLLAREVIADAAGSPFRSRTIDYSVRPLGARSAFPARVKETTFFHEGETAAQKTTSETLEYDELGNVIRFADQADNGTADDVLASVSYHVDPTTYVIQPERIEVRDGVGRLLRQRTAAYDGFGDLVRLEQTLAGGKDPESGAPYGGTRNAVSTFSYDGLGNLAASTDPSGFASSFTYDPTVKTHPVQVTDSFGYTSRSAWDLKHGVRVETVDRNGNAVRQSYDAFGRLVRVAGPYDSDASPTLAIEYDPTASPARAIVHHKDATRPDPIDSAVFVDALGRTLQTQEDAELDLGTGTSTRTGVRVSGRVAFDAKGRIAAEGQPVFGSGPAGQFVDVPLNNPTALSYDTLDRVREVRFPHGAVTRMAYGFGTLDGEVRLSTVRTDANGRATRFYNDVKGDVLGVEQANTIGGVRKQLVTRYGYDALSQLTSVLDAKGKATRLEYDTLGRNVVLDSPDAGRTEMRYHPAGDLGAKITANLAALGQQVRYLRTFHRLDRIDYPQMPDVAFTYGGPGAPFNRAGRIVTVTNESGVEERSYGKLGEVVRTVRTLTAQNGNSPKGPYTTAFRYDSFERLLSVVYPDGEELTYTYDAGGKVQSIPGYLQHQGYDQFGGRVRTLFANGAETRASYDPASRFLARLQTLETGGRELQDLVYQHDGLGTVLAIQNGVALPAPPLQGGPVTQTFRYDDLYQLVGADGSFRSPPNKTSTYKLALAYDEIGNTASKSQLQQVANGGGKPNTEEKTSYDWAFAYGGPRPRAATRIGDRTFRYDLNGNQTGWDTDKNGTRRTLAWDEENRLKSAADNGQTTRFLYGADGVRTSKAGPHGETLYVNAWYSVKNGTIGSKHVFAGGARIATKLQSAEERRYFYHSDHLGSTNFVTDDLGKAWQHLEYFPYGEVWVDERSESQRTPYLFGGKELDEETGLSYIGARYYEPRQGQWISADPILDELLDTEKLSRPDLSAGSFHLPGLIYGYVANSPTNFVDPTGLGKTIAQLVGLSYRNFGRAFRTYSTRADQGGEPLIDWKHVAEGGTNWRGKPVGYHWRYQGRDPEDAQVGKIISGPNDVGVYFAQVWIKNSQGIWLPKWSTFFPDAMNKEAVGGALLHARKNGVWKNKSVFEGPSGFNFDIRGYVYKGLFHGHPLYKGK